MKNITKPELKKYPRTPHIESSGIQFGDEDMNVIPFSHLEGKNLVIEEKIDGASTGISFSDDGDLLLQCRGHYLLGGDWTEFDQFKVWANTFTEELLGILEDRYIMYGEWMYAFHSVYYDKLPHYFMEFDIYDKQDKVFLDTERRHEITESCSVVIEPVRVIKTAKFYSIDEILDLIGLSEFISDGALFNLEKECKASGWSYEDTRNVLKLNSSRVMEGLYIKWEEDGIVKERYKYVRSNFVQSILDYGKHWTERKTIPNRMSVDRDLFEVK